MIGLQISALIFSFAMIYFALIHFKKGTLKSFEMIIWLTVWLFAIFSVVFTDILRSFAKTFNFTRLFDMMVFGGFFLVIILAGKSYVITKKVEKKVEKLVRDNAIQVLKGSKKDKR